MKLSERMGNGPRDSALNLRVQKDTNTNWKSPHTITPPTSPLCSLALVTPPFQQQVNIIDYLALSSCHWFCAGRSKNGAFFFKFSELNVLWQHKETAWESFIWSLTCTPRCVHLQINYRSRKWSLHHMHWSRRCNMSADTIWGIMMNHSGRQCHNNTCCELDLNNCR